MIQGGTSTRAYQTSVTLTSCTVAKQATNLRPESGSPPGSPEPSLPWSPPCARTRARSEVEFQEALGCTCGGEGWVTAAPVTAAASFSPPQPFARRERFPRFWRRARAKLYRALSIGHVQGPVFLAQALLLPSASDGWRCPGCAPGTWALLLSGGCSLVPMRAAGGLQRGQPRSCPRVCVGTGGHTHVRLGARGWACTGAGVRVRMCVHVCTRAWVCTHIRVGVRAHTRVHTLTASPQRCGGKPEISPWRVLASCSHFVQSLAPKWA